VLSACSTPPEPAPTLTCVEGLTAECSPLYAPPEFTTLYTKILHPSCATGQTTCHSRGGSKGGLVFEDEEQSYGLLLGQVDGRKRVIPGDPGCSILMERLEIDDDDLRMPPGPDPLSAGERCDFVQWITNGAPR
jgi:hypothetical protein